MLTLVTGWMWLLAAGASSGRAEPQPIWQSVRVNQAGGLTVHLKVRSRASLADEEWIGLEFAAMRDRLRRMLELPEREVESAYLVHALLGVPEISNLPVETLLAAIDRQEGNRAGRGYLVEHLERRYSKEPKTIAWYLERLRVGDARAAEDLWRTEIWSRDFVAPLVETVERLGSRHDELKVSAKHRADWPKGAGVPARLSARVLRDHPVLVRSPADVWKESDRVQWVGAASALAQTGDSEQIPLLEPHLDRRDRVLDLEGWAPPLSFPLPATRARDVALESILSLMGEDPHAGYEQAAERQEIAPSEFWVQPRGPEAERKMDELRNVMIVDLKKRLERRDSRSRSQ